MDQLIGTNSKRRQGAGFTLLEVVAALFIIAVALLAMGKMQTRSLDAAEHAGRVATALRLAQDVIEQMQARGVASWVSSSGEQVCPGGNPQNQISCPQILDPEGRIGTFRRRWTVSSANSNSWADMVGYGTTAEVREVEVIVTWGTGKTVTQRSLLTRTQ